MRNINDYEYSKDNKYTYGMANINYNPFNPLMDQNIVCYKCNTIGHKAHDFSSDIPFMKR